LLAERGARVFGTVRNPQSASPIRGVEIVGMEVTNDASVSAAVQSIEQKAGPVQLLVNNAGYSFMVRWKKPASRRARQQFETNLFGVLRVTNAILPECGNKAMDESSTSVRCWVFCPRRIGEIYAASKHAVEGYTEHWTTRSGDSVCARCWSNPRTQN
jgi:NAD(P)-dependent dehydrogenase (short-subunit alcohol dehydrogenase family)